MYALHSSNKYFAFNKQQVFTLKYLGSCISCILAYYHYNYYGLTIKKLK